MAGVRLSLVLVGMLLLIQSTAANPAEAPTVATPTAFFGAKMGKEEEHQQAQAVAEAPEIRRLGKHHFHSSMAGGGVLIGGLATTIFAVIFCYIRVTRKPNDVN